MITDKPHTSDTNRQHTQVGWIPCESEVQLEMDGSQKDCCQVTQCGMARVAWVHHAVLLMSVHPLLLTRPLPPRPSPALGLLRQKASSGYLGSPWATSPSGKRWGLHG